MAEFKAEKAPAGLEHAYSLGQRRINMRHIAQTKGNRIDIKAFIREGQAFGIARRPLKTIQPAMVNRAVTSDAQHMLIQVAHRNIGIRAQFSFNPKGNITRTASNVEEFLPLARANFTHETILPKAVHAAGHQIIHQIVIIRHRVEDTAHKAGFLLGRYIARAELCAFRVLGHGRCFKLFYYKKQCAFGAIHAKTLFMSLAKAITTVAGLTGLSRIAGFTRDILTASILGAGPVADAFFIALRLPNFFRRITAEGAFSVSFVPLYAETLEKEGREEADIFAGNAFMVLLGILAVFVLLAMWAMPFVITLIAPGFQDDPERFELAIEMARTTFPYLLFMSLTALLGGVLNALNRFAPFAFAPILFNLTLITALLLSDLAQTAGHALAFGVFAAGIVQFAWLAVSAYRAGVRIRIRVPQFTPRVKKVFALMGPGVIGAGVMHINLFADMIIASLLETGSISYLYYADRLNQLPMGIVGVAVGTALLPMLSRAISGDKLEEARELYNRAMEYCLLLAIPAATGLAVLGWPIVVTLFHHGEFSWHAAEMSTLVVTSYCAGMPAYIAIKIFSTAFWAKQDTMTPVKISVATTIFNILFSLWLVFGAKIGVIGIAIGTSLTGWLQIALFIYVLRHRADARFDARFMKNIVKIIGAAALMALGLYLARGQVEGLYAAEISENEILQIVGLAGLVITGIIIYAFSIMATGVIKPADMKRYFKKGAKT